MTSTTASKDLSLTTRLKPFLRMRKAELTLGEVVARMDGDDGLGPSLFVLTLPVLLPLPPGVSMVLALPLLFVALQIVVGRRRLWLPKGLRRHAVKRDALVKLLKRILPILERAEQIVHPRLFALTGGVGARMIGIACTLIAIVLILPIPFANLVPAIAMGVFAVGLTRRDGVVVLAGYGLVALAVVVVILGIHGIGFGIGELRSRF